MEGVKKAGEYASEATDLLTGSRQNQNGDKLANHLNIARLWTAYLQNASKMPVNVSISPSDVSRLMVLLKVARSQAGNYNPDDYVDMIGYSAISGEISNIEILAKQNDNKVK